MCGPRLYNLWCVTCERGVGGWNEYSCPAMYNAEKSLESWKEADGDLYAESMHVFFYCTLAKDG